MGKLNHLQVMSVLDVIGKVEKEHNNISLREAMFYIYRDIKELAEEGTNSEPCTYPDSNIENKAENKAEDKAESKAGNECEDKFNKFNEKYNISFTSKISLLKQTCKNMDFFYEENKNTEYIYPFVVKGISLDLLSSIEKLEEMYNELENVDEAHIEILDLQAEALLFDFRTLKFRLGEKISKEEMDYFLIKKEEILKKTEKLFINELKKSGESNLNLDLIKKTMKPIVEEVNFKISMDTFRGLEEIKNFRSVPIQEREVAIIKASKSGDSRRKIIENINLVKGMNSPTVSYRDTVDALFFTASAITKNRGSIYKTLSPKAIEVLKKAMEEYQLFTFKSSMDKLVNRIFES